MSCPTCDHTVAAISVAGGVQVFQCDRCGTTIVNDRNWTERPAVYVPKLVERCRKFEKLLIDAGMMTDVQPWRTLGIAESINLPGDRPNKE